MSPWTYRELEVGYDIQTMQELLSQGDVKTTMIYIHVLNRGAAEVRSPFDGLEMKQEGLMLIRIRCRDKKQRGMQLTDIVGFIAEILALSRVCYAGRKSIFRRLCGSF